MDDQLLATIIALLGTHASGVLAWMSVLSLVLAVVKPALLKVYPVERWPSWLAALFVALDFVAANTPTIASKVKAAKNGGAS